MGHGHVGLGGWAEIPPLTLLPDMMRRRWLWPRIAGSLLAISFVSGCYGDGASSSLPLLPGDTFEADLATYSGVAVTETPTCWTAYVTDPDCPACNRLASLFASAVNDQSRVYWLFVGQESRMREFTESHAISPGRTLRVDIDAPAREVLDAIGIRGTPVQLVLDQDLVVRHMSLSERLLSGPELDQYCAR